MNFKQLDAVHALLKEARAYQHTSLEDLRRVVDERNALFQPPTQLAFEPVTVPRSGKPALQMEWGTPADIRTRRTILYLHGGGFMVGRAAGFRGLAGTLAVDSQARVLLVDYRLAPEHPFPAAIEDATDAYAWLLETGIDAKDTVLVGDSAGAALALSTILVAKRSSRALPAAAVLFSPWVDLSLSGRTLESKKEEDLFLAPALLQALAQAYLAGAAVGDELASPLSADLHGLPPLLIQVGSAEILLDDAMRLAEKVGSGGGSVTLEIWPHMPHVWQLFAPLLHDGRSALAKAASFIVSHFEAVQFSDKR